MFLLVCSVLLAFVCTAPVFSRLCPPGRFCSGLVSYSPCCVGSDLLSFVLLCSSPVYPFFFAFVWFIVLFRSALVQAHLFSFVRSVLAGLFCFGAFGMYCSGLFSPVPSWQVQAWFGFSCVPSCVGSDLSDMFCSAPVWSTVSFWR